MTQPKLYQWPGTDTIESIYPRSVVFHRICNIVKQEINVVNISLPKSSEKFEEELQHRLLRLPILEVDDKKFTTSQQIVEYFLNSSVNEDAKRKLSQFNSMYGYILRQWSNESFLNSLLYARWKNEKNFQRFSATVKWGQPIDLIQDHLDVLRKMIIRHIDRTPTGVLSQEKYIELLKNQFWSLESMLNDEKFFEPMAKSPTMTDLYIFMVIQGFLDPNLEESKWIRDRYKNVVRWFDEVNLYTS